MSAAPMLQNAFQTVEARARDLLLLEGAERVVRSFTPEQQNAVRAHYDAAVRRADVADELADDRSAVAALILYREAAALLIAAIALAREPQIDAAALLDSGAWDKLIELARSGKVPELPENFEEARQILEQRGALAFDSIGADDLITKRATAESAVRWLRRLVEPRTLREIRTSRFVRVGIASIVALALIGGIARSFVRPTNLALHKPVTISQRHPQSTAPVDNSGLVNGEIESTYGVHTSLGGGWVMVDLQEPHTISKIKVFNRADGWFDEGLPFLLEFSDDGAHFTEVERHTEPFTSTAPWIFDAKGKRARYIRVRSNNYVALTELEVYGR